MPIYPSRWARLVLVGPLLPWPGFASEPAASLNPAPVTLAQLSRPEPSAPAPAAYSDAIRVLGRERSAAEDYAVLLDTHGKKDKDISRYVRGIELYADAKAEFDGLIEGLKAEVGAGRDPAASAQFKQVLDAAAQKRIAFTSFVSQEVIGNAEGAKPALPVVIAAAPALITALTTAGVAIWKAWAAGNQERRAEIIDRLDRLKWRAFADLAKG